ncbi:hypothetical protein [uncultured Rossellomorea sp.]|uniref:hypothetical protein n=1 Tax=uncultured Rossellomorea sp. TaxID=2837549 RepID=UPI0026099E0D|nr:hypothetical protein [uncultured Rossellomorea sp.]
MGFTILIFVYNIVNQSPKKVVTNIMEDVQENKEVEEISNENQKKLQYFFEYSKERNLENPNLIVSDFPSRPNIVTVTIEIIQNDKKKGIKAIYEGRADFYLKKQGLKWEVEKIQVTPYKKER